MEALFESVVRSFYSRVREDGELGPIFAAAIGENWEPHLQRLFDIWSSSLLRTGRYSGQPLRKHLPLKSVRPEHFERWLALFRRTCDEIGDARFSAAFVGKAQRIVESFKLCRRPKRNRCSRSPFLVGNIRCKRRSFMKVAIFAAAIGVVCFAAVPALAADHQVQMANKDSEGRAMQFEPAFLQIEPGDTVSFISANPGHNSETIAGAIPEAAEPWKGKINEEITVTFTEPGIYAYKCLPHFALGMVGLIQVGDDTSNLEAVRAASMPGRAADRMDELLAELEAGGGDAPPAE